MTSKLIVYGSYTSPPVRAVRMTLMALKLDYEFKLVSAYAGENRTPEFLAKNPQHTVPTLEDDGTFIWDSHAIMAYLVRKYGKDDSLYPKDFYHRAVVDQRLHYENGVLFMTCVKSFAPAIRRGTLTKESLATSRKLIGDAYDMLETFLATPEKPYFAGNHLTIADLSIVSSVCTLDVVEPVKADTHPNLAGWFNRMKKLPFYEAINGKSYDEFRALAATTLAAL